MTAGRSRAALLVLLTVSVMALALPVTAQVTRTGSARVYEQVRSTTLIATVVSLPAWHVSEPLGLSIMGVALAISARFARRRMIGSR